MQRRTFGRGITAIAAAALATSGALAVAVTPASAETVTRFSSGRQHRSRA